MDNGIYPPDGITRKLIRERAMLLGGPRALLLQLAHPLVAAGVADHSSFPAHPVTRLRRTLDLTLRIVFGTTDEAHAAAARINAVHARVHGRLREPVGRYAAGTPYDALDPELLLWVHATLVDTTLVVYDTYVARLTDADREAAWQESKIAARLLQVPDALLPGTLGELRGYMHGMLRSDAIAIGPQQRAMGAHVLYPPLHVVPKRLFAPGAVVTVGLLPEKVRAGYGLHLGAAAARAYRRSAPVVRTVVRLMPERARLMPQARTAVRPPEGSHAARTPRRGARFWANGP